MVSVSYVWWNFMITTIIKIWIVSNREGGVKSRRKLTYENSVQFRRFTWNFWFAKAETRELFLEYTDCRNSLNNCSSQFYAINIKLEKALLLLKITWLYDFISIHSNYGKLSPEKFKKKLSEWMNVWIASIKDCLV